MIHESWHNPCFILTYLFSLQMGRRRKKVPSEAKWRQDDMEKAYNAVFRDGLAVHRAARMYCVPRKTLDDRVKGRVALNAYHGGKTALTCAEEISLRNYIVYMAGRGFPLTIAQVKAMAHAISMKSGNSEAFGPDGPTNKWWRGFRHRHPSLTLRRPDPLDRGRASQTSESVINDYFKTLENVLKQNDIENKPHVYWNCDETVVDLNKSTQQVVVPVRSKHAHSISVAPTDHVTALCCVNAAGQSLPPMIVFKGGFPGGAYTKGGPVSAIYAKSDSGFVDGELFVAWFRRIFLKYTSPVEPRLLLLDGHASHLSLKLIDLAIKSNVILLCLPPHTTHLLQPLDVAVYKALKVELSKIVNKAKDVNQAVWISKTAFSSIFRSAYENAFTMSTIGSGFEKCGVYPFNPKAIDSSVLQRATTVPLDCDDLTPVHDEAIAAEPLAASPPPSLVEEEPEEAATEGTSRPCPPALALHALETAMTPKQLQTFPVWYETGRKVNNNPMYLTWRRLKEQITVERDAVTLATTTNTTTADFADTNTSAPAVANTSTSAPAAATNTSTSTPAAGNTYEDNLKRYDEHTNILLKYKLITPQLVDILRPAPAIKTHVRWSKRREIKMARVLTDSEVAEEIREQENRKRAAAEKKAKKSGDAQERNLAKKAKISGDPQKGNSAKNTKSRDAQKGNPAKKAKDAQKGNTKKVQQSRSGQNVRQARKKAKAPEAKGNETCDLCTKPCPGATWVQCDLCDKWYHCVCVGLGNITTEEVAALDDFFCPAHGKE